MQRTELLKALEVAGAALGRTDLLPSLACLWFDGKAVSAFDDNVGITTPCKLNLEGGVKGALLTSMVGKTKTSADIEVSTKGTIATFKIGPRTTVKLPVMPTDQRQFMMPKTNPKAVIEVDRTKLRIALEHCLKSVGDDVTHPEWCGITFRVGKSGALHVCSGYAQVFVKAALPLKQKPKFQRVVLPAKFCELVLRYFNDKDAVLELHDSHALLRHPSLTVFGRSLSSGSSAVYIDDVVDGAVKTFAQLAEMPKLEHMLTRASVFEGGHHNMKIAVVRDGKRTRLRTVSNSGDVELTDLSMAFDGELDPVQIVTNAKHLRSGAGLQQIGIHKDGILMHAKQGGVELTQVVSVGEDTK